MIGCPDPHVERWYLADAVAFEQVVGAPPGPDRGKCERYAYRRMIEGTAATSGIPLLTGTADLAPDIVARMDLFRAGKSQACLGHFVSDLRAALRQLT